MGKAFLVVRMKGQIGVPYWAKTTLDLLKLEKKFRATIIPSKDNTLGMLNKIKHYVSWQEVDALTAKELLDKKGRKMGYKKITEQDLGKIGFKTTQELASSLADGKTSLSKLKPLKPWFALAPPRHGFKRNTKKMFDEDGILGHNKELSSLIKNMM
ncbi:MAG: 50S ribosomal protein L30 [Nitrosopumilaceae archaeon]|nr:50S ribosomal protein L30 [Nitrosopumilaceae archaeon]